MTEDDRRVPRQDLLRGAGYTTVWSREELVALIVEVVERAQVRSNLITLRGCHLRVPPVEKTFYAEVEPTNQDAATPECSPAPSNPAPQRVTATGALSEDEDDAAQIARTFYAEEACARAIRAVVQKARRHAYARGLAEGRKPISRVVRPEIAFDEGEPPKTTGHEVEDEAASIARTCCADIHQERCAYAIRALVEAKVREERSEADRRVRVSTRLAYENAAEVSHSCVTAEEARARLAFIAEDYR